MQKNARSFFVNFARRQLTRIEWFVSMLNSTSRLKRENQVDALKDENI